MIILSEATNLRGAEIKNTPNLFYKQLVYKQLYSIL